MCVCLRAAVYTLGQKNISDLIQELNVVCIQNIALRYDKQFLLDLQRDKTEIVYQCVRIHIKSLTTKFSIILLSLLLVSFFPSLKSLISQ